jgi:hypothetical protein
MAQGVEWALKFLSAIAARIGPEKGTFNETHE